MKINLIEYFEQTVKENSDKTAVVDGESRINFSELYTRVLGLASQILEIPEKTINRPVAVYLPKSIECIIADIAITFSGNAYMNLDIKSPATRIESILTTIDPLLIITDEKHIHLLKNADFSGKIITIQSQFTKNIRKNKIQDTLIQIIDTDPYCIINTSGSTGTPKGVVLNQKSFIDFTEWAIETLEISNIEIVGSLSPVVFDIFSFELCMLMVKGNTLVLIPEHLNAFPVRILELLHREKISFIFWVPTIMVNIANMNLLESFNLPDLKSIWFAGEVFPTKQFNFWKKHLPETKFVNLYGPIEITLDCTYFIADRTLKDDEPIPIGFPCRNTDILILNENNLPVTSHEEGELFVRGTSLAMGYYNNPEKTSEAFIQNPLNNHYPEIIYRTGDIVYRNDRGEIMFKGRKDSLIKHLGYRIELAEIEHILVNSLKIADNACVVYQKEKKEITVFYESLSEIPVSEFRRKLAGVLPKYMIPTVFIYTSQLPRNTNGKIDRLKLQNQVNES